MSKRSYMEAVLEGIRSVKSIEIDLSDKHKLNTDTSANCHFVNNGTESKKIYVRLLLSIDRRETAEAAMETVSSYNVTKRNFICKLFKLRAFGVCYLLLKRWSLLWN